MSDDGCRRRGLLVLGCILAGLTFAPAQPPPPLAPAARDLGQARYDAAVRQYQETWAYYQQARIDSYQVYVWSKLIMESRQDMAPAPAERLAAIDDHLARMKKLESLIKKVRKLGFGRSYDVGASEYYRLEAEYWLARQQAAKP